MNQYLRITPLFSLFFFLTTLFTGTIVPADTAPSATAVFDPGVAGGVRNVNITLNVPAENQQNETSGGGVIGFICRHPKAILVGCTTAYLGYCACCRLKILANLRRLLSTPEQLDRVEEAVGVVDGRVQDVARGVSDLRTRAGRIEEGVSAANAGIQQLDANQEAERRVNKKRHEKVIRGISELKGGQRQVAHQQKRLVVGQKRAHKHIVSLMQEHRKQRQVMGVLSKRVDRGFAAQRAMAQEEAERNEARHAQVVGDIANLMDTAGMLVEDNKKKDAQLAALQAENQQMRAENRQGFAALGGQLTSIAAGSTKVAEDVAVTRKMAESVVNPQAHRAASSPRSTTNTNVFASPMLAKFPAARMLAHNGSASSATSK